MAVSKIRSQIGLGNDSRSLLFLLILTIAVVALGGWFANSNFDTVLEEESWVRHTAEVKSELDQLLAGATDTETGMRGFLLTHDQDYLEPYKSGVRQIWDHFNQIKALTPDNPVQVANVSVLEEILRSRLKGLGDALEIGKQGKVPPKADINEGRVLMDSMRNQIARMKQEESRLMVTRVEIARRSEVYFHWSILLTTLLTMIVLIGAFARIRKDQTLAFDQAEAKDQESWLQGRVAEVAQLVAEDGSLKIVARRALEVISQSAPLAAANIYWLKGRELNLVASYGTDASSTPKDKVVLNASGLLGEAFNKAQVLEVKDLPQDYFKISSSLGHAIAAVATFVPLVAQGRKVGVIELAGFAGFEARLLELFKLLTEPLGAGLAAVQTREEMQALLDQTQFQSEELQTQQEELRTNNEELEQQARAMESQKQSLSLRNEELEHTRQELEQKATDLEKASQYKSDFLAKMSHELRTPLNSLLILATLLTENKEGNLNARQIDFSKAIRGAGNDLLNLINDILDLSKIEARKLTLRPEAFTVRDLVENLRSTFAPQAQAKNLEFKLHFSAADDGELYTDRLRLEQVLRNFLSNALKFTEKGTVTLGVQAGANASTIRFLVSDTGVGIAADKQRMVFDAFEQADSSVSRKFGGTGLGLTISRELAQLLGGGEIRLESELGEGSTFILEIPKQLDRDVIVPEKMAPAVEPEMATPSMLSDARRAVAEVKVGDKTILIVEDDPIFRETVVSTARGYGFVPIETSEGEIALEILNLHRPSAILLDIKLPGISGMGLLEIIKKRTELRHIPIHMISAMDYQQNAFRLGAMGYLSKPVSLENLRSALSRIENLLSHRVKRLLIVEDDTRQREAIQHLVEGIDIEIRAVPNGEDAIQALQEQTFDCVILDLSLPGLSGFDVLKRMNELEGTLPPVVIYTAQALTPRQEEYLSKYSESIIIKGARSPERLLDEVNLFLHRVESRLPESSRAMIEDLRTRESTFDGKQLLLVDDDLRNVFALTSALEGRGWQVVIARDGIEAVEAVEQALAAGKIYDAILMDLMMPRMDGLEATRRIRKIEAYKKVPIVALTAKAMKEDQESCLAAGATDYLPKPIDLKNLFSVLNVWLKNENLEL